MKTRREMVSSRITDRVSMIDTVGLGNPSAIAVYVVRGDRKTAVIDCGYASSNQRVMEGLRELGVDLGSVDYLIPTHVHLDHAGAAGHLITHMPRAKIVAHERAVPHLIDPTKLIESATSVFGEKLIEMYGRPLAIVKEKIEAVGEESHIDLGGASLTTLHSPGHAPHQISILLEEEHLLFSADAVGMVFPSFPTLIPTTPPPSLDPVKLFRSLEMLGQTGARMLLVPHYGVRGDVDPVLEMTKAKTEEWIREVTRLDEMHMTQEGIVDEMRKKLVSETGIPMGSFPSYVNVPMRASVLGIITYQRRLRQGTQASRA
jgi:glyoxylase-like metal-dependent hydrolase (beta-lactamase superfamily II)